MLRFIFFCLLAGSMARGEITIPCELQSGMVWLRVDTPGGKALHFLLDSGAGANVLDLATARGLGVGMREGSVVQGVHYRTAAYEVPNFAGFVNGIKLSGEMLAFDLGAVSRSCGRKIDGLIGMDFFRHRVVQIDYKSKKVRVLDRGEFHPGQDQCLPLSVRRDSLCIKVQVANQRPEWMRVDSGCNSALEWVAKVSRIRRMGLQVGVGASSQPQAMLDVKIGSRLLRRIEVGLHPDQIFPGEAGLIGNGILGKFGRITFDVDCKRIFFGENHSGS